MITLKVKTKSGMVQTLQVEALLEVDGERWRESDGKVEQLERRLELLERLLVPVTVTEDDETVSIAR